MCLRSLSRWVFPAIAFVFCMSMGPAAFAADPDGSITGLDLAAAKSVLSGNATLILGGLAIGVFLTIVFAIVKGGRRKAGGAVGR